MRRVGCGLNQPIADAISVNTCIGLARSASMHSRSLLADQLGQSVGDIYLGAIGRSLLSVGIFIIYIVGLSTLRPQAMPPLPPEARGEIGRKLIAQVLCK